MKKSLLSAILFLLFIQVQSQTASGTFTFSNANGFVVPLDATATSLLNGAITYPITGNTNTAIAFSGYNLTGALGVDNEFLKQNLQVLGNPSSEFNAILKAEDYKSVIVNVFDVTGKLIATPQIEPLNNGSVEILSALSNAPNGMYFVQIQFDGKNGAIKFLKTDEVLNKSIRSKGVSASKTAANENYTISWDAFQGTDGGATVYGMAGSYDIELVSGSANAITIPVTTYTADESGDVAIITYLKGIGKNQVTITAKNTISPEITYSVNTLNDSYGLFENIYVSDANNPTAYEFTVIDNASDGTFIETIETIDVYQDVNYEINGSKIINLDEFSNFQTVTMLVKDEALNTASGLTVKLYNASDTLLDTQTTNSNGEAVFSAPENTAVHFSVEGTGYYKKINGDYTTPTDIVLESQRTQSLSMIAAAERNYDDGTPATATELTRYYPLAWNISAIVEDMDVYHPADINKQQYIDHFDEVAILLDRPGMFGVADTRFSEPTQVQKDGMNPYIEGRELYTGLVGYNVDDTSGTSTLEGSTPKNGLAILWYSQIWNLGGTTWARTDHEIGWMLGFPALSSNDTFKTSRDIRAGESVSIAESKWDRTSIDFWLDMGGYHFNGYDYAIVKKVE